MITELDESHDCGYNKMACFANELMHDEQSAVEPCTNLVKQT